MNNESYRSSSVLINFIQLLQKIVEGFNPFHYQIIFLGFLLMIFPVINEEGMIYGYFFGNSNVNSIFNYNMMESPPGHPINNVPNNSYCDTKYSNDPSIDSYCIRGMAGLYFPNTNSPVTRLEGNLNLSLIRAVYPKYSFLLRIFVDPTIVNTNVQSNIMFIYNWDCGSYFNLTFEIKFISQGKIKIYVHIYEWDEDRPLLDDAILFYNDVPEIISPTWVDASIYFVYDMDAIIPICFNEKLFQIGEGYTFPQTNLPFLTGMHESVYLGE